MMKKKTKSRTGKNPRIKKEEKDEIGKVNERSHMNGDNFNKPRQRGKTAEGRG